MRKEKKAWVQEAWVVNWAEASNKKKTTMNKMEKYFAMCDHIVLKLLYVERKVVKYSK